MKESIPFLIIQNTETKWYHNLTNQFTTQNPLRNVVLYHGPNNPLKHNFHSAVFSQGPNTMVSELRNISSPVCWQQERTSLWRILDQVVLFDPRLTSLFLNLHGLLQSFLYMGRLNKLWVGCSKILSLGRDRNKSDQLAYHRHFLQECQAPAALSTFDQSQRHAGNNSYCSWWSYWGWGNPWEEKQPCSRKAKWIKDKQGVE